MKKEKHKNSELINAWKSYKRLLSYAGSTRVESAYQRYLALGGTHKRLKSLT